MNKIIESFLIVSLFSIMIMGCENVFEPLEENNTYVFSINGILDVHADTQWVRVMPIGESLIPTNPDPNGTEVSLIYQKTDDRTVLKDSLFKFGNEAYVWNYWTLNPILANENYTIVAMRPDGRQSRVSVKMPSSLPIPEIEYSQDTESITVSGRTGDSLIIAETRYLVQPILDIGCGPEREVVFSHLGDIEKSSDGTYSFSATNREAIAAEFGVSPFSYIVNQRKFVIISAGEDWPDLSALNDWEISLPDAVSNVTDGTGMVAGIARRELQISPRVPPCVP